MLEALSRLDLGAEAPRLALALMRTGGIVAFCPVIGSEILPMRVRSGLAVVLAVAMLPVAPAMTLPSSAPLAWIGAAVREIFIGLLLGLAARALFAGIEAAAVLVAGQTGFALPSMVDPISGDQSLATSIFVNLMAAALFLAADLHHLFILGLRSSYDLLPPSMAFPETKGLLGAVGLLGTRVFTVGVELAAPALVVTFAVDLVIALVSRAAPQFQIFSVGFAAKMGMGFVALALLATAVGSAIGWIGRTFASDGARLLAALAGR